MKVQNKIIVVTGGGNGIGRELVLGLLTKGATVIALDINPATLEETRQLAAAKAISLFTHVVDITDKNVVQQTAEKIIAQHGFIDGLINNAGIIQPFIKVNDLSYEVIERVMN